ncbi:MAG TPA: vitamin B12 dependent-methionine synthase activation domain-containing protein, partial [Longimicrobiales bacterium]|nr:vitamin B12 dependent-methionine synthase activation domain-containing protein [Longimicrobiales bacterium]
GVVGSLLDPAKRPAFMAGVREEYGALRERHRARRDRSPLLSIEEARRRRVPVDWSSYVPPRPARTGVVTFDDYPLAELVPVIDWTPFFQAWELPGKHPDILDDPRVGEQARSLLKDARALLDHIVEEGLLVARGVAGSWPAGAVGDDVALWADAARTEPLATAHFLRQQFAKDGRPNVCLADFVAPVETGLPDHLGAFAVTAGVGLEEMVARFQSEHDDYRAILAKALADRLAEAFAERLHQRVRAELWAYAPDDLELDNEALVAERYRGIRPAPGYPACPDHTEKRTLFRLLDAEGRAGIRLTESCAMLPGASVSGWYLSHPDASYFGVGRLGADQVEDYAARRGIDLAEAELWLSPVLGYEPEGRPEAKAAPPRPRASGEGAAAATGAGTAGAATGAGTAGPAARAVRQEGQ